MDAFGHKHPHLYSLTQTWSDGCAQRVGCYTIATMREHVRWLRRMSRTPAGDPVIQSFGRVRDHLGRYVAA